jgi:hypothetical protein
MKMPESLLIIAAILLPFTFQLSGFDVHISDTYYIVSSTISNIFFIIILIIQFVLQLVLRMRARRIVAVAWLHVLLSLISLVAFLYLSYLNNAAIQDADNYNKIGNFFQQFASLQLSSLVIFALIQILFVIYFIKRLM